MTGVCRSRAERSGNTTLFASPFPFPFTFPSLPLLLNSHSAESNLGLSLECANLETFVRFLREMNGVMVLGVANCAGAHICHSSAAATRASLRPSLSTSGSLVSGSSSSSVGSWRISGLPQSRPLKKVRPTVVRAVVELNTQGQQVGNGTLRSSKKEAKVVLMVDPLEAKRLAAVEWKQLQDRAAFQRQREIEAINGGWAVLGLTIGVILEGYTGNGILAQVASYLDAVADFLARLTPGR